MPSAYKPFHEQLAAALRTQGVSQRELAKRLAKLDGTKPESKRRWIGKLLTDDVEPGPSSVAEIEQALNLPGYFKRPEIRPATARRDRLAELEGEVAQLRAERDAALQAVVVRLAELEADLVNAGLRSTPKTTAKTRRQR